MNFSSGITGKHKKPDFVASHDSATGMVLALSSCLKGEVFEGVGAVPSSELYAKLINTIPVSWRKKMYSWSGKIPATSYKKIDTIDASEIDRWVCDSYPEKQYPAIAIGSSNGAMIHFCAALGIPWLPQTLLIPIDKKDDFPVDEPKPTMHWAKKPAEVFLKNNPDWQLHHMMDPNQDRLRVNSVGYFRVKKTVLGSHYKKFIEERLAPGGTILLIDCELKWPVKKIGERHYFQFGGLGGLTPDEYYNGSKKVQEFLKSTGSDLEKWDAPIPDKNAPEAEWGLAPSLARDLTSFTAEKNILKTRISFDHPQDISAPVADFFRCWYRKEGIPSNRLLVESFNLISPLLSLKKHCVPYWLAFIDENSAAGLESFLKDSEAFDEIYMMVLSHGKNSIGSVPVSRWESFMKQARNKCAFVGTNPKEYPVDMAVYARYSRALKKTIKEENSVPPKAEVQEALKLLTDFAEEKIRISVT